MCPVCVANAAMAVAGVTTTGGGVTTVVWRILRWKKGTKRLVGPARCQEITMTRDSSTA
jgi:hypothetical protein